MVVVSPRRTDAIAQGAPRSRGSGTVLTWIIPHLIAHVAARGFDVSPLHRIEGLQGKDINDPDTRISDAAAAEVWKVAEQITGDDALGLHVAESIPAGALDLLEYAFRASPTLRAGLDQLFRYGRVLNDRAAAQRFRSVGDTDEITWSGGIQAQRIEFAVALLVRIARDTTGAPIVPLQVRFDHAPPEDLFEHRAFFRAPIRFEEPVNQLLLARSDTARPLRGADPALWGVVRRRLEKMLMQVSARNESTTAQARRMMLEGIPRGESTAAAIARGIGLSERTLHRHLRAESTSFREVLDAVRSEIAASLLQEPNIATAEVAYLLGYSDSAAFHRAFRRWTGKTPLAFRRASRAAH